MKQATIILLTICMFFTLSCNINKGLSADPIEMYEKAVALIHERSFKEAKPLLEEASHSFRDQQKNDQLAETLTYLAQTYLELGEFRSGLNASDEAVILMHKGGNVHGEIKMTVCAGDMYTSMRMYGQAIAKYNAGSAFASAFDDKLAYAEAQVKLAYVYKINGDFNEALEIYKNVLTQAQATDNRQHIAEALGGIGSIYRLQQRYLESANSLTQGLASVGQINCPVLAARLQMEIGLLHSVQNSKNAALKDFQDAVNTLRRARTDKDYETVMLFRLGNLYEQSEKLQEAKRYYNEAIELARSQGDYIAENYLSIFLIRNDYNIIARGKRSKNVEIIRQSYEQIARKFQECRHIAGEGYIYTQLGKDCERTGDLNRACAYYLKAITLDQNAFAEYSNEELHVPYQSALGISPFHRDWYELLSAVLIKLQRQEEALKILEFARMKQHASAFQEIDVPLRYPKVKQLTKDVRQLIQKARMLEAEYTARFASSQNSYDNKDISTLHEELEEIKNTIRKNSWQIIGDHANFEELVMPIRVDVSVLRKNIPSGTLAIEFMPTENKMYIFAVTNSKLIVRTSDIRRDSLLQLMNEYRRLLQDPTVYSDEAAEASITAMTRFAILSTHLYDVLLRPVDDLLERSLIIVADQQMDGFPFHAIERQDTKGDVKYMIELMSVDYIPSLASLRYRSVSSDRLQDVAAFGNPTGKNWSADYELRDIRSFFRSAKIFVGLETSWSNLKSVKADVLQISSQFSCPNVEYPLGNIVLSDGLMVEQSTTVSFEKLAELEAVPVMLLSNQYGQGVGLSTEHALLLRMNGTSDIFLNTWLADRKAAKFFSEYFFTHLANGLAPGDAYRQALLNLIRTRESSQPHSWAQFFHYGVG